MPVLAIMQASGQRRTREKNQSLNLLIFNAYFQFLFVGTRNGLLPFPLNSDFINNYRRLYGPVQFTSIVNGNDSAKVPHRSPVDSKRFKGMYADFWRFREFFTDFDPKSVYRFAAAGFLSKLNKIKSEIIIASFRFRRFSYRLPFYNISVFPRTGHRCHIVIQTIFLFYYHISLVWLTCEESQNVYKYIFFLFSPYSE